MRTYSTLLLYLVVCCGRHRIDHTGPRVLALAVRGRALTRVNLRSTAQVRNNPSFLLCLPSTNTIEHSVMRAILGEIAPGGSEVEVRRGDKNAVVALRRFTTTTPPPPPLRQLFFVSSSFYYVFVSYGGREKGVVYTNYFYFSSDTTNPPPLYRTPPLITTLSSPP